MPVLFLRKKMEVETDSTAKKHLVALKNWVLLSFSSLCELPGFKYLGKLSRSNSPKIPIFFSSKQSTRNHSLYLVYRGFRSQGSVSEEERINVPISGTGFRAVCQEAPQEQWIQVPAVRDSRSPVPHFSASPRA